MKKFLMGFIAVLVLSACTADYGTLGNRNGGDGSITMSGKVVGGISSESTKITSH